MGGLYGLRMVLFAKKRGRLVKSQSTWQGRNGVAIGALLSLACVAAQAVTVVVPGKSNPNLAGRASDYTCCSGDSVALHAPILVTGLPLLAGQSLTFAVSGRVSHTGSATPGDNPDGDLYVGAPSNYGVGITAPTGVNRINALVGVFLSDAAPAAANTPAPLSFASGLGFLSLSPLIGQQFFIGNGLTGDTNTGDHGGQVQTFAVPSGATRLYLGTSDGFGWYNNSGAFTVGVAAVPEPATFALVLAGALTLLGRRRQSLH